MPCFASLNIWCVLPMVPWSMNIDTSLISNLLYRLKRWLRARAPSGYWTQSGRYCCCCGFPWFLKSFLRNGRLCEIVFAVSESIRTRGKLAYLSFLAKIEYLHVRSRFLCRISVFVIIWMRLMNTDAIWRSCSIHHLHRAAHPAPQSMCARISFDATVLHSVRLIRISRFHLSWIRRAAQVSVPLWVHRTIITPLS